MGLEPTPDPPTPVFSRDPKALPTELRLRHTCFSNEFYLTIPLMIRMTTKLIPSGFLAYNQLLNALTGLMVIADIIMIGKLILKVLQGPSTGFGFQVQQGVIPTTLA